MLYLFEFDLFLNSGQHCLCVNILKMFLYVHNFQNAFNNLCYEYSLKLKLMEMKAYQRVADQLLRRINVQGLTAPSQTAFLPSRIMSATAYFWFVECFWHFLLHFKEHLLLCFSLVSILHLAFQDLKRTPKTRRWDCCKGCVLKDCGEQILMITEDISLEAGCSPGLA